MTYKAQCLAILVIAAAYVPLTCWGQFGVQGGAKPIHGLPGKLQRLQDLELIQQAGALTPLQRSEVLLTWLVEERRSPTPTTTGATGGPVDSNYIQAQIVETIIGGHGDAKAIMWLASCPDLRPEGTRRPISLALGYYTNDLAILQTLLDTATSDANPFFRQRAIHWLGHAGADDPRIDTALEKALLDPYVVTYHSSHSKLTLPGTDIRVWRPVREAAEEAIRNRRAGVGKDPEDKAMREQGLRDIERGLVEFARENRSALERLLKIAKSDRPARRRV